MKTVKNYWQNGNVSATLNTLSMINDPGVIVDFLNSTFAKG